MSDHLDFIPLESYAGKAEIHSWLSLTGLKVTAKDRLRPYAMRAKRRVLVEIGVSGFKGISGLVAL